MSNLKVEIAEKRYEELYPLTLYENSAHTIESYEEYLRVRSTHRTTWIMGYITGWSDWE